MAENKQSIFQPILGENAVSTSVDQGFNREYFQDNSKAEIIKTVGEHGVAAFTGYQEASLENKLEEEITDYLGSQEAERELNAPGGVLEQQRDAFNNLEAEGPHSPEEEAQLDNFNKEVGRLRAARASGIKSPLELRVRLEKITKEYINSMPGLADNFRRVASNEIGDYSSELRLVQAEQDARAKAGATQEAVIKSAAISATGMGIDSVNQPFHVWWPQFLKANGDKERHRVQKQELESGRLRAEILLNDPVEVATYSSATRMNYQSKLKAIVSNPELNPVQKAEAIAAAQAQVIIDVKSQLDTGTGKEHVITSSLVSSLNQITQTYNGIADNSLSATAVKNANEYTEAAVMAKAYEDDEFLAATVLGSQLRNSIEGLGLQRIAASKVMGIIKRIRVGDSPFGKPGKRTEEDKAGVSNFFKTLTKWTSGVAKGKDVNPAEVPIILESMKSVLDNWSPDETSVAYDGLMELAANPDIDQFLKQHDKDNSIRQGLQERTRYFVEESVSKRFAGKFDSNTMSMQVAPGGDLYVTANAGSPPTTLAAVRNLRQNYVQRFNQYTLAEANLQGKDRSSEITEYFVKGLTIKSEAAQGMGVDINGNPEPVSMRGMDKEQASNIIKFIPGGPEGPLGSNPYDSVYIPTPIDTIMGYDVDEWGFVSAQVDKVLESVKYNYNLTAYVVEHLNLRGTEWGKEIIRSWTKAMAVDPNTGRRSYWNKNGSAVLPSDDAQTIMEANAPALEENEILWESFQ